MLRTITIGNHLSVQGYYVQTLTDGQCQVRVGSQVYAGRPIGG